jgi:hypothetical protein
MSASPAERELVRVRLGCSSGDHSAPSASNFPRPCEPVMVAEGELARELVVWAARHGVATARNLSVRFGYPERTIMARLCAAEEARLLRRAGVLRAEPELFVATRAGLRAVGIRGLRVCAATPRAEGHLRAVASAAVWLERRFGRDCDVLSERELLLHSRAGDLLRGRRLASPYVHHGGGAYKRPDLLIRPTSRADGLPVAVEVELSRKSVAWLRAICAAWNHCPEIAGVLYLVAPHLLKALRVAIEHAGAQRRIVPVALHGCDVPTLRRRAFYKPQPFSALEPTSGQRARATARPACPRGADAPRVAEMLGWVGRWGVVGLDSLALHLGIGEAQLWETIERADHDALVRCALILRAENVLCWATRRGLRAAGLSNLPACVVNYSSASSGASLARIAARLEREHPGHAVLGPRELRARGGQSSCADGGLLQPFAPLSRTRGLGQRCTPAMLLVADHDPSVPVIGAFLYTGPGDKLRIRALLAACADFAESVSPIVYVARDSARRAAARALVDLEASDRVQLRPLPLANTRRVGEFSAPDEA